MQSELIINGNPNTYQDMGVSMGDGFIEALNEPLTLKDPIENIVSRSEHGIRIFPDDTPVFKSREVTLDFIIEGNSPADLRAKRALFLNAVYKGYISIQVPEDSSDIYRLYYRGNGTEYGMNYQRTFCRMMLRFEETDPTDRGVVSKHGISPS